MDSSSILLKSQDIFRESMVNGRSPVNFLVFLHFLNTFPAISCQILSESFFWEILNLLQFLSERIWRSKISLLSCNHWNSFLLLVDIRNSSRETLLHFPCNSLQWHSNKIRFQESYMEKNAEFIFFLSLLFLVMINSAFTAHFFPSNFS